MARLWRALVLFVFLPFASIVAASNVTDSNTPSTEPPWPPGFPVAGSIEMGKSQNQTLDKNFICKDPNYSDIKFNLVQRPNCGTQLSQDLYGWGVRIGFYTTWFASLFANFFIVDEIRAAVDANSIFLFALEISVVKAAFYDNDLRKVDALILFLIGNGTAVGALSLWGRRTKFWYTKERKTLGEHFGGIGIYARLLLCFFLGLYGIWFWYSPFKPGLLQAGSCDPRCWGAYIFGTGLQHRIRWFFFTFALISELYWAGMIFLAFACCFPPFRAVWRPCYSRIRHRFSRIIVGAGLSKIPTQRATVILPVLNFAWYILIITIIEVTLHQNRVIGTLVTAKASTSPAQLIPFLVGVVSLARLIWAKCTNDSEYKHERRFEDLNPFVVEEKNGAHSDSGQIERVGAEAYGQRTGDSK